MQYASGVSYIRDVNNRILSRLKYFATPIRRKPDYLILGAQKSGTSTLFKLLSDHPEIHNPYTKELHYFDWHYNHSFFWYRSHFPINWGKITGEATPIYLFHPEVPSRIKAVLPQCKFIVILRNPVDRAYSHYQMVVRKGFEKLSFEDAIKAEPERMHQALEDMRNTDAYYSPELQMFSYLSRGKYHEQLERWFALYPKNSFHVLSFENYINNTQEGFDRICDFLGIPLSTIHTVPRINADSYDDINSALRTQLNNYFAPHNESLFALLGTNFPWQK